MLYAEDRRTGTIILARNASPYGSYRCPTCQARVFPRLGQIYAAHFAHEAGQGKPECEEYHPSTGLRRHQERGDRQTPPQRIDGLSLSIELEPDQDGRSSLRRWGLRVTVPKSYDARGQISMDLGGGDVRRIALSKLVLGAQTYSADPAAHEYGAVWVSPEVRPEYRQAVTQRIAGLNRASVTPFAAVAQKLKPRCYSLRWGECYYFVWPAEIGLDFPSSLLRRALADHCGWCCCMLVLPDMADPEITAWLKKKCNLQVIPAKQEWALLHPPPYGFDEEGNLLVEPVGSLLLALKSIDQVGKLECTSAQQYEALSLIDSQRHLVEIGINPQKPTRDIQLRWNKTPLISLRTQAYREAAIEPSVIVEFGRISGKTVLPLHHTTCHSQFRRVRTTNERILKMRANARLQGQVRFRRPDQFEWNSEPLSFRQPDDFVATQAMLPSPKIELLNTLLKDLTLAIVIDFGPYGSFAANALVATGHTISLPQRLRARIEWLCQASSSFLDAKGRPVRTLDDAALIKHFKNLKSPVWLVAHRRATEHDVRRYEDGLPI